MANHNPKTQLKNFEQAFNRFRDVVSEAHATAFNNTTIDDVQESILEVQTRLAKRGQLTFFKRLEPLLAGIRQYSDVLGVLCNGTSYLSWIWAPIKLLIQIAENHIKELEKLIGAYSSIAKAMPRFDRLSHTFKKSVDFQRLIDSFYVDVLEFHRRTYIYFNHKGWKTVFIHFWSNFDQKFKHILESLEKQKNLIDTEAKTIDIEQAKQYREENMELLMNWREESAVKVEKEELNWQKLHSRDAMNWLDRGQMNVQSDMQNAHIRESRNSYSPWILELPLFRDYWLNPNDQCPLIWLNGNPGSGKSVHCAQLVQYLRDKTSLIPIYYYCTSKSSQDGISLDILRNLVRQLIQNDMVLSSVILEKVNVGADPDKETLMELIKNILPAFNATRIIIDGIDEPDFDRPALLETIEDLFRVQATIRASSCKILISSRDVRDTSRICSRLPSIYLSDYPENANQAISKYIDKTIPTTEYLQYKSEALITNLKSELNTKAQGMFLWVRLVFQLLDQPLSETELYNTIQDLPTELETLYKQIFGRICGNISGRAHALAERILQWLVAAERPLHEAEIRHAIALDESTREISSSTQHDKNVFDLCKPVFEKSSPANTDIRFIHFTALEYLRKLPSKDTPNPQKSFNPSQMQFRLSLACILYLISSFRLIDPDITDLTKQLEILHGKHELCFYANDFFHVHLIALAKTWAMETVAHKDRGIMQEVLTDLAIQLSDHSDCVPSGIFDDKHTIEIENLVDIFELNFEHRDFLAQILHFRLSGQPLGSPRSDSSDEIPSPLSRIRSKYLDLYESILTSNEVPQGVDNTVLQSFRQAHEGSLFYCRYNPCNCTFNKVQDRNLHEQWHLAKFKCQEHNCAKFREAFNSKQDFDKHAREYHTNLGVLLPKSLASLRGGNQQVEKSRSLSVLGRLQNPQLLSEKYPWTYIWDEKRSTYEIFEAKKRGWKAISHSYDICKNADKGSEASIFPFQPAEIAPLAKRRVYFCRFSPDGNYFAVSFGGELILYEILTSDGHIYLTEYKRFRGGLFSVIFSPLSDEWLVWKSKTTQLENFKKAEIVFDFGTDYLNARGEGVFANKKSLVVLKYKRISFDIWDYKTKKLLVRRQDLDHMGMSLTRIGCFSIDDLIFAAGSGKRIIKIYDTVHFKQIYQIAFDAELTGELNRLCFHPKLNHLIRFHMRRPYDQPNDQPNDQPKGQGVIIYNRWVIDMEGGAFRELESVRLREWDSIPSNSSFLASGDNAFILHHREAISLLHAGTLHSFLRIVSLARNHRELVFNSRHGVLVTWDGGSQSQICFWRVKSPLLSGEDVDDEQTSNPEIVSSSVDAEQGPSSTSEHHNSGTEYNETNENEITRPASGSNSYGFPALNKTSEGEDLFDEINSETPLGLKNWGEVFRNSGMTVSPSSLTYRTPII